MRSGEPLAKIPLDRIAPGFQRAEVRFEGLRPPQSSYEARVYLDGEYLGSQHFYGLGLAVTTPEPSSIYDSAGPTQASRREIRLNITDGLRRYFAQAVPDTGSASLSVVAVDRDGNRIAEPDLDLEGLSLVTT